MLHRDIAREKRRTVHLFLPYTYSQSKLRELRETTPLPTKIYAEWKLFASKEKSDRRQRAAHYFRYKITHNSDTQKRTLEQNIRYSPKKGSHPSPQEKQRSLVLLSSLPQKKPPRARSQASSLKNKEILTLKAWLYWEVLKKYKYAMR